MNNSVIKDLFNKEEIQLLKNDISKHTHVLKLDEPQLGRTRYDLASLPESVMEKVQGIAKRINENLRFDFAYYVEYSSAYGEPCLPVHTDSVHSKLVIDYQLESNINWSIYVNVLLVEVVPLSAWFLVIISIIYFFILFSYQFFIFVIDIPFIGF